MAYEYENVLIGCFCCHWTLQVKSRVERKGSEWVMAEAALEAIARAKAIAAKLNASMDTGRKRGRWDNEPGKESEPQRTLPVKATADLCVIRPRLCVCPAP